MSTCYSWKVCKYCNLQGFCCAYVESANFEHEFFGGQTTCVFASFEAGDRMIRMYLEHERYHVLGMVALVTVCSWNTNIIMVWAWLLWV